MSSRSELSLVIVTQEDPFYLPEFFKRFLISARQEGLRLELVAIQPSFGESKLDLMKRMYAFHGPVDFLRRGLRFVRNKVMDWLGLQEHSVERITQDQGVDVACVTDVNEQGFLDRVRRVEPDVVLSVSAPQIFGDELLDIPSWGCLNVHSAPLPRYRGMMPNFWQMKHGRDTAGLTVHRMDSDIDRGEIVLQSEVPIRDEDSLDDLIKRSKRHAADVVLEALEHIREGTVELSKPEGEGSYHSFPTREDVREFREQGRRLL